MHLAIKTIYLSIGIVADMLLIMLVFDLLVYNFCQELFFSKFQRQEPDASKIPIARK